MSDLIKRLRGWPGPRGYAEVSILRTMTEAADKIGDMQDEIEKLRAALKECADDLEEEINGKYRGSQNIYIHEMHRFDRDMAPVTNARKLLQGEKK